jgi:predicted ATPase
LPVRLDIWKGGDPPTPLIHFIVDRGDGVPLFIEELTKRLREKLPTGPTTASDWEPILADATSLKDLLSARLSALRQARKFAQVASRLGRDFSLSEVSNLLSSQPTVDELDDAAASLLHAGLIEILGAPDDRKFGFRHALIQEAAHDSLLGGELEILHNRIVELALNGALPRMGPDLLANCEQAGLFPDAARFAIIAAEGCAARSAIQEADRLLSRASRNLDLCQSRESTFELSLRLLCVRGVITSILHGAGSPLTRNIYDKAIAICRASEVKTREKWFPLYWGYWFTAPNFQTQRLRAQLVVGDLANATDPEIKLQALHCLWATSFNTGEHLECVAHIENGLQLYDPVRAADSRIRYGHDAKVCALGERALSLWLVGKTDLAERSMAQCMEWSGEINHLGSTCHALDIAVTLAYYLNDAERIPSITSQMDELAERYALPGMKAKALIFGGWAKARMASLQQGLFDVDEGLTIQKQTGTSEDFPVYYELRADLLGRLGRLDDAVASLNEMIERALAAGHLFWLPELYRRRAILRGRPAALEDLRAAETEARRQGAWSLVDRAAAEIQRLHRSSMDI